MSGSAVDVGVRADVDLVCATEGSPNVQARPRYVEATLDAWSAASEGPGVDALTLVDYPMPRGSLAGYYPELNPLLPLDHYDRVSGCPAAKSIPVRIVAAAG